MSEMRPSRGVVVGVDGSPAADRALAFALEEAKLRRLPLTVISASEVPALEYAGSALIASADLDSEAEHHADSVLGRAAAQLGSEPGVEVDLISVHGHPATVLLEYSEDAEIVVVGTRGHGSLAGALLGSVSQAVAHKCAKPVVVVSAPR